MKTIVITGCHESMWAIHDLTIDSKRKWAATHGYDILEIRQWNLETIAWDKMRHVHNYLQSYDYVAWIDGDSIITRPDYPVEKFVDDHHVLFFSQDWGRDPNNDDPAHFNAGNFIGRSCENTHSLFERLFFIKRQHLKYPNEQGALQELKRHDPVGRLIKCLPGKDLNAVPDELHPGTPNAWDASCFLKHLTGASDDIRIQFLKRMPQ